MNTTAQDIVRQEIQFSGRVQGVGFRQTTVSMARSYTMAGTVRNMADGRVELILEGPAEQLNEFVAGLEERFTGYITDVVRRTGPVQGMPPGVRIVW